MHSFKVLVTPPGSTAALHTVEDQWSTTSKNRHGTLSTNVQGAKEEVSMQEVDAQDAWEIRRLWRSIARGICEGDFETVSHEKSKIEVRRLVEWHAGG